MARLDNANQKPQVRANNTDAAEVDLSSTQLACPRNTTTRAPAKLKQI